jgi:hypothetical protein
MASLASRMSKAVGAADFTPKSFPFRLDDAGAGHSSFHASVDATTAAAAAAAAAAADDCAGAWTARWWSSGAGEGSCRIGDAGDDERGDGERCAIVRGGPHSQRVSRAGTTPVDVRRLNVQYCDFIHSFVQSFRGRADPKKPKRREDDAKRDADAVNARGNESSNKQATNNFS